MSKLTNLLIPLVFISTGAISCANYGVVKKQDITDQQFVNTINQDGSEQQVLPQPEKENITSRAVPANIPTIEKPSSITNTNNKQADNIASGKDHVDNLTGVEQGQIKLNQVGLAHLTLGIAYAERDLIDQAICEFQSAIKANPHHLESYVRLGTTYGLKGMTNEALSEFKKAIDINLNEAVAKIVFSALPVTANQKVKTDVVNAHINLGNAYKEEGELKRSQLEYEKALELKPEHSIASKSLSEIYYTIGTSCLENKEYDNAIDAFNTVLKLNPDFPQIKDALEKAHYNLGINYAENGKLDKAIIEFNKTMEINRHYAMLDKNSLSVIGNDKKAISDNRIHSGKSYSGENIYDSTNNEVRKESLNKEEQVKESLQKKILHQNNVTEEMIPTKNSLEPEKALLKKGPHKEGRDEKRNQEYIAYKQTEVKQETGASLSNDQANVVVAVQANSSGEKAVAKNKTNSDYKVYTYNITKNYKTKIEVNEAIKRYEDDTIKNPYDNNAILNLAYAYYRKAMYLDDAIARREDAQEDNQNFSVKQFYLLEDTNNEKNSDAGSAEQTKPFERYNIDFPYRLGNMYEEMFHETVIGYKNTLRINPCSSNALYGLAFSFAVKGSSPGVALKNKNNPKGVLSGY
ncbi:MAG: tetratricopeptide repeat protein [Candidatus Scalindua sp.]|nr:tetratricopeptide repeat protein [Candidatus Scalindua sp.]MCR4345256.1 tetratricopeptide repeat protein [Candidatus Scalindua sp.]